MKRTNKKGFTIVELVVVIAVIAILAAVLIPNLSRLVNKANESKAMQEAKAAMDSDLIEANGDYAKMADVVTADGTQLYLVTLEKDANAEGYYLAKSTTTGETTTTTYEKQSKDAKATEEGVYYAAYNGKVTLNADKTAAVSYQYVSGDYTSTFTIADGTWEVVKKK